MSEEKISPKIIVPVVLISMVSGLALAFVNSVTAERIELVEKNKLSKALEEVMPGFSNDPLAEKTEKSVKDAKLALYPIKTGERLLGHAVESSVNTGYAGEIGIIFGVKGDGSITDVKVLKNNETPGLGSKASEPAFLNQFKGKSLADFRFKVRKDGGDVQALTGATITSRAVALALDRGLSGLRELAEQSK